jgi:hypothetical protein
MRPSYEPIIGSATFVVAALTLPIRHWVRMRHWSRPVSLMADGRCDRIDWSCGDRGQDTSAEEQSDVLAHLHRDRTSGDEQPAFEVVA